MKTISLKSLIALCMVALAYGILPTLLLPYGGSFGTTGAHLNQISDFVVPLWPFWFDASALTDNEWFLLFPVVFALYAIYSGKKAYHGLWAAFIAIGFMLKTQELDAFNDVLLGLMVVFATINAWAYLKATGDTLEDWLRYKYGTDSQKIMAPNANGNTNNQVGSLSAGIMYPAKAPTCAFKDVIGMTELKARLSKAGKDIIAVNGARNGILLTGDPGNGKTTMAEALAGELKLNFISVSFGNFVSAWVGQTTERVMKVFDDAEKQAPCVLFLDEVEAVLIDRNKVANADSEAAKTVSALLKRLEDIRSKRVVVVAASNYLDRLDPAAIREGRFDYKIEVTPPDFEARKFLLTNGLQSASKVTVAGAIDRAAKRWEGYSVARIRAIATEALEQLKENKFSHIGFDELMQSLRNLQASMGSALPEDTPGIAQLVLEPEMRTRMLKLANRMVNIENIEEMGGSVPSGVLYSGPAGTGKTLGAKALAKETKWAFIATTGHDLLHKPDEIDSIMKKAKDIRPCIIFIDEADDVLADRKSSYMSKDVTNKLLTVMDGVGGRSRDVLFIAATNDADIIDDAMLRGGRFSEKIAFTVPGEDALHVFVAKWMTATKAPLADDFTADVVVKALIGESLANVGEILQLAVNEAIPLEGGVQFTVSVKNIDQAIELFRRK